MVVHNMNFVYDIDRLTLLYFYYITENMCLTMLFLVIMHALSREILLSSSMYI